VAQAKWLPFDGLVKIALARFREISVGRAQNIVRKALASGDVRRRLAPVLLVYDDGLMDMNIRPGATNKGGVEPPAVHYPGHYSVDDFLYWLRLNPPQAEPVMRRLKPATRQSKRVVRFRAQDKRKRAEEAVQPLWPDGVPDATTLPNKSLCALVIAWLRDDCNKRGIPWLAISNDTILRAAGRK
jgi:hypothetical protein